MVSFSYSQTHNKERARSLARVYRLILRWPVLREEETESSINRVEDRNVLDINSFDPPKEVRDE